MNSPQHVSLLSSSDLSTQTASNGKKYCSIRTDESATCNKPITFLLSDSDNCVENFILQNTMHELAKLFGTMPNIDIFSANNDVSELRRCFDDIRRNPNKHGAVVALSEWTSGGAHQHISMDGYNVPVLFANVSTGHQQKLQKHSWVNGIGTEVQNYKRQLETIKDLLPGLRRLIIPRDILHLSSRSAGKLSDNVRALITECEQQNIEPILLSICPQNKLPVDIKQFRSTDTMFMLTRESSVLNQMQAIINTCNGHRMPIFSDLPLPTLHGAAFGTGNSGLHLAAPLAEMIRQVIKHGRPPQALKGAMIPESNLLLYNNLTFRMQGIEVSEEKMRLLEAQHIAMFAHAYNMF